MQQESKQFIFTVLIIHFLIDSEEKKKRKCKANKQKSNSLYIRVKCKMPARQFILLVVVTYGEYFCCL